MFKNASFKVVNCIYFETLSQSLKTKRSGGVSRQIMSSGGGREASAHNKLGPSEEGKTVTT